MNDADKIEMAVRMCRERAAASPSPQKEALQLYADLLPVVIAWENKLSDDFSGKNYLEAMTGCLASFACYAASNVSDGNRELMNELGPDIISAFSQLLFFEVQHSREVAVLSGDKGLN